MCIIAMGRESSLGEFRLGKRGETSLRISKPGGKKFWDDPVYVAIVDSLKKLAAKLRPDGSSYEFFNPFLTITAKAAGADSIALGHPLGCTGAKLTATLLYELKRRNARYGMVTMCVGGGMGAAGIFERI